MIRWKKTYWGDSIMTVTIFILLTVTIMLFFCIYVITHQNTYSTKKSTPSSSTDNSIPLKRKTLYDIILENAKLAFLYYGTISNR